MGKVIENTQGAIIVFIIQKQTDKVNDDNAGDNSKKEFHYAAIKKI